MSARVFRHLPVALSFLTSMALGAGAAQATPITTNFSNFAGIGFGVGTTQTISQNGITLDSLQGLYEVTFFPEVNLKDFGGSGATREIELTLTSGQNFDFEGFSIRDLCCSAALTLTSSRGGSFAVSSFTSPTFSGPLWEDLDWVRFSYVGGRGSEAKFTSFTLNDEPTAAPVPEPGTLLMVGFGVAGFCTRRWRQRTTA